MRLSVINALRFGQRLPGALALLVPLLVVSSLVACSSASPQLTRLYQTSQPLADQPPVILVHGAFGGRLCDSSGKEHWPGNLLDLVFNDYHELALPFSAEQMSAEQTAKDTSLSVCGVTDTVAGRDFYGKIADTLVTAGGYQLAEPGTAVNDDQRRYYQFVYDWRQDNALSASKLDALVEQIRRDYQRPDLRVDVVAHSMGGLLTRYWLRYGVADMLNDNDFPVNNSGGQKVRRVILVGTPNLGSTNALQQLLRGGDFGVNTIKPEVLLTFPGAYQLLPHPIVDAVLGSDGEALDRDIFDLAIWRALEWGPYDPALRKRLGAAGWSEQDLAALERYTGIHLERARRFVWSLTVENPAPSYELVVFGGDCNPTPARIVIEDVGDESHVRLWPKEIKAPRKGVDYASLMLEPGDGAVTKASLLARTTLDPSIPRHRFSDFPLDYSVMFCEDHSKLTGNLTFQDNLLHILLSR
jgi:pimeloyl-ACP methyl ester carboxylesterase